MDSTFTPRTVAALVRQNALPGFLLGGWLKGTGENIALTIADLIYLDKKRKLNGLFLTILTVILCLAALYGMEHANLSANRYTHQQTAEEAWNFVLALLGWIAAFCVGFAAFACFRFKPEAYSEFSNKEEGFGWNLAAIMNVLGKKLEELNAMGRHTVWSIADQLLVIAAKNVLLAERDIKKRFEGNYRKPEWKYEPEWDRAKNYFEQIYYMFERFDLADPNGFDYYYDKARDELLQEELKQKA